MTGSPEDLDCDCEWQGGGRWLASQGLARLASPWQTKRNLWFSETTQFLTTRCWRLCRSDSDDRRLSQRSYLHRPRPWDGLLPLSTRRRGRGDTEESRHNRGDSTFTRFLRRSLHERSPLPQRPEQLTGRWLQSPECLLWSPTCLRGETRLCDRRGSRLERERSKCHNRSVRSDSGRWGKKPYR